MIKQKRDIEPDWAEEGLAGLVEYMSVTGILMVLLILMIIVANAVFIEKPSDTLKYHSYVDIGNGVSTRIVDLYIIAPSNGTITTMFDIPDDIVGTDYYVELEGGGIDQKIGVTDGNRISANIAIAGIGATKGVTGKTTGAGWNRITYDSEGVS
jgi:hypothetical protein